MAKEKPVQDLLIELDDAVKNGDSREAGRISRKIRNRDYSNPRINDLLDLAEQGHLSDVTRSRLERGQL